MWTVCCGIGLKKKSKMVQNDKTAECKRARSITPEQNEHLVLPESFGGIKIHDEPIINGGYLKHERRSLPDVVIPSTVISARRLFGDQRPSFQIDSETGRRPTLDIEATALLAKSESIGFDSSDEGLRRLLSTRHSDTDAVYHRVEGLGKQLFQDSSPTKELTKNDCFQSPPKTNVVVNTKRFNFTRLLSHSLTKTLSRKRNIQRPADSESSPSVKFPQHVSKGGGTSETSVSKDDDISDLEGSKDSLGQLPSSGRPGLGRLNVKVLDSCVHGLKDKFPSSDTSTGDNRAFVRTSDNFRRGSLCIFSHLEEPIVTPFAQILASLRRVRANLILLINATSSKDSRLGTSHTTASGDSIGATPIPGSCEQSRLTATETLDELEWCLERLENIQTHRSVSDMATSKFRKMLNKELSHFTEGGRNAKQISEYICSTFLESKEVDGGMPCTHPGEPPLSEEVTGPLTDSQRSSTTERNSESNSVSDSSSHGKMQGETTHPTEATGNKLAVSDSVTEMPTHLLPHGIASSHPEQLSKLLSTKLDLWGMDAFELGKLTPNPLTCVFYAILQKRGLIKRFCIPEMNLIRYMKVVEENYHDVPYHNRLHATDVVQSAHVLLSTRSVATVFTDLEVLSVLFACAIHDVDHPGLTNQYLINTNDQLAILYNDASVLENHHLAVAFRLLTRPGCDLFENIPRKQRLSLRRMTIDMVLATDMSKHMSLLADLKTMVETKRVAGSGILTLDNYSDRMQILQSMIHCADLSNPTKPLELYRKWNARIMEEHFRQGDRERESGLELSPMCDRTTASIEKTQVSFIDYIAHPLWETWSELVHPDAQHILDALDDNREWYLSQIEEESIKP